MILCLQWYASAGPLWLWSVFKVTLSQMHVVQGLGSFYHMFSDFCNTGTTQLTLSAFD